MIAFVLLCSILVILLVLRTTLSNEINLVYYKTAGIEIGNGQWIGTREHQEDSFASQVKPYGVLAVVADGIEGQWNGKQASSLAVNTFSREFIKTDVTENIGYYFQRTAKLANQEIRNVFQDRNGGTTLIAAVITRCYLFWGYAGNSQIAVYRNGKLIPINKKQNAENWLEEQYLAGNITREEALIQPYQDQLINYIGYDGFRQFEVCDRPVHLKKGDKVVVYTDGLETLSQIELEDLLGQTLDPDEAAENIIEAIKQKNCYPKDNVTFIIIQI